MTEYSTSLGRLCDHAIVDLAAGPSWARILAGPQDHSRTADHFTASVDGVPLLSPGAISADGRIVPGTAQRLRPQTAAWPELSAYRLRIGDILLARQGSLGHSAFISPDHEGWFYNAALYRMRVDADEARASGVALIPEYLQLHLSRPRVRRWMIGQAVGQTVRTLTIARLRALRIPLPSVDEQLRLCRRVESIERQMARHRLALALLAELKESTIG